MEWQDYNHTDLKRQYLYRAKRMKAKSEKRLLAEHLRMELGFSYSEIAEQIGVSKSTLSHWLKHISLTPDQEE